MKPVGAVCFVLMMSVAGFAESPAGIVGDYVEVRSNEVYTCGCRYSGEQVTGGREAILAWDFQGGDLRGTPLAGSKVAAVIVGDGNLGVDGVPRKSILYLDSASPAAQERLPGLLRERYATVLGEIRAVHLAAVSFRKDGDQVSVKVGELLNLVVRKARLPEDAHQGSLLWYAPFVPVSDPTLGTTLYDKYWGGDFNQQWWVSDAGITGYYGSFSIAP